MVGRDESILEERLRGETFREIGERHGISTMRAHTVYGNAARRHLDDLELRLLANTKTDELEVLLIPDRSGPAFDAAIDYLRWVTHELAERGVTLKVHPRPAINATPPSSAGSRQRHDRRVRTAMRGALMPKVWRSRRPRARRVGSIRGEPVARSDRSTGRLPANLHHA